MKILSIGAGLISALLLCGRASAVETDYIAGTRAMPLQQEGGTARAMGMGSAVVAVSQGSASLLWNPAGLSRLDCMEAGLHHNSGLGDTIQEVAIFGMPLGGLKENGRGGALGGLAASIGYVSYGSFDGRDENELPTGHYQSGDFSGSAGWGMDFVAGLSGGIVLKANQSRFGQKSYNAFTTDAGLLWTVIPGLDLGATYTNINLGRKIGGSQLSSGWRLGAAWSAKKDLIVAASGEVQPNGMHRIQLGGEYLLRESEKNDKYLALRAGYQMDFPKPQLSGVTGLTLGVGYTLSTALLLDYAMVPEGELGTSHRLSLTYKFNCSKKT